MPKSNQPSTHMYVIGPDCPNESDAKPCKIGIAYDANKRLRQLQAGSPIKLKIWRDESFATTVNVLQLEQMVHANLGRYRLHGEWFDLNPSQAIVAVNVVCDGMARETEETKIARLMKAMELHPRFSLDRTTPQASPDKQPEYEPADHPVIKRLFK